MPYSGPNDSKLPDTVKALSTERRAQWANVWNSAFARCQEGDGDDCEGVAFRMANGVVFEEAELFMPPSRLGIDGRLSVLELRALSRDDTKAARWARGVLDKLSEANMTSLQEVTKTIDGEARPAGDFLVVEDREQPSTWHLPVKVNGKVDRRLMGAAWAALHEGSRGNKYEGPGKAKAIRDLTAMYKSEELETPPVTESAGITEMSDMAAMYAPMGATTFADLRAAEKASEAADQMQKLVYQYEQLIRNITMSEMDNKLTALKTLTNEFLALAAETLGETMTESDELSEFDAPGLAVEVARDATEADLSEAGVEAVENGRRAPVIVDFEIIRPGPGNKQQNRYYPAEVLRRDIGVFEGATVFVTDHREKERSERTKVGKVIKCPTRFAEGDIPIGEVLIYDPDQAEKARNRHDAGELGTLECSIYGKGRGRDGKIDGQKYKIIEAITEGVYLELVSKAGAGGRAVGLSESSDGGETMEKEQEKQTPDETQVEEVEITENQNESAPETEPVTMLEADAVQTALDKTRLPDTFKRALALAEYEDETALQKAVDQAIAEVKSLTGSGQPFAQGASEPADSAPDFDTIEAEHTARINAILAEVGIRS